jgi:hypothetical protein
LRVRLWDKNTSSYTSVFKDNLRVKSVIFVVSCHMGGHKSAKSGQKLIFSSLRTGNIYLNNTSINFANGLKFENIDNTILFVSIHLKTTLKSCNKFYHRMRQDSNSRRRVHYFRVPSSVLGLDTFLIFFIVYVLW